MLDLIALDLELLDDVVAELGNSKTKKGAALAKKIGSAMSRQRYGAGEQVAEVGEVPRSELEAYAQLRKRILLGQNEKLLDAVRELVTWEPEYLPEEVMDAYKENGAKKGQVPPFFCAMTLYELLGKDVARSLLARIARLCEAFGTTRRALEKEKKEKVS